MFFSGENNSGSEKEVPIKNIKYLLVFALIFPLLLMINACGDGGGGGGGNGGGIGTGDFVKLSINNGTEVTYNEKSGLSGSPPTDCDPRVDWAFSQVILNDGYLGGTDWEKIFAIQFLDDSVGIYNTAAGPEMVQPAYITGGMTYLANWSLTNSSAVVEVTRSDTRIVGTFIVNTADSLDNPGPKLEGSFDVASGFNLSCE